MSLIIATFLRSVGLLLAVVLLSACTGSSGTQLPVQEAQPVGTAVAADEEYRIGPGDVLRVFVWRSPELSSDSVPVRPDGKISTPLVEDLQASGKTPTQLARDVENVLREFIKTPVVTVMVSSFVGNFSEQIRVVGEAARPQALAFRTGMTLLDVLIEVGGLTEFAAGRRAKIVRRVNGQMVEINVRPDSLIEQGDMTANVDMQPGDVLIIPQARF